MQQMTKENLTSGSLWKKILWFALPLAITNMLQQLFNAADIAVVGRFTGAQGELCMAAIGATSPIVGLIINAFANLAIGTNVILANAIGKGDHSVIRKAIHTSILFSLLAGVFVFIIGEFFSTSMLALTGVPDSVLPLATLYLRIYFCGAPVILLYNFEAAIFRASGDTKTPLVVLTLSGLINVILNLFFVLVLHMTVSGVAIATVVSNAIGATVLLLFLIKSSDETKVSLKNLKIQKEVLLPILKIGIPSGLQGSTFYIANMVVQSAINSLDTAVMAGSSAALNVETLPYLLFASFAQACVTFVSQNRGAKEWERCKKTKNICLLEAWISWILSACIIVCFGKPILSLFNTNPQVIEVGYQRLTYIVVFAHSFFLVHKILGNYLRGFGISLLPSVLTMIGVCGTRVVWTLTAFRYHPTFGTLLRAFPLSMISTTIFMLIAVICLKPAKKAMQKER